MTIIFWESQRILVYLHGIRTFGIGHIRNNRWKIMSHFTFITKLSETTSKGHHAYLLRTKYENNIKTSK